MSFINSINLGAEITGEKTLKKDWDLGGFILFPDNCDGKIGNIYHQYFDNDNELLLFGFDKYCKYNIRFEWLMLMLLDSFGESLFLIYNFRGTKGLSGFFIYIGIIPQLASSISRHIPLRLNGTGVEFHLPIL